MKNKKSRTILFTVILSILSICLLAPTVLGAQTTKDTEPIVVFDALQYNVENDQKITEEEIINRLGEPQKQEDWNYKTPDKEYPIHTITYENREYSFYEGVLQRITLYDEFAYTDKNDFLGMFNLSKNANTTINDTNSFYRAYNCGVHDLWIQYGDGKITLTKISYGGVFSGDDAEAGQTTSDEIFPYEIALVLLAIFIIFCIVMLVKTSKARKNKKQALNRLKSQGLIQELVAKHTYGLPVAEGLLCTIQAYRNHIDFYSGNVHISLSNEKIIDVCTKSETEIQQQYVSSVGGAVGGAVLFGPLGAMIGGRAKKKTATSTTSYLIITYMNTENNIAYIGFDVSNCDIQAKRLVLTYKQADIKGSTHIEL